MHLILRYWLISNAAVHGVSGKAANTMHFIPLSVIGAIEHLFYPQQGLFPIFEK